MMETFNIAGSVLTHTLIDLDYIIRYSENGVDRLISSRNLKELLDKKRGSNIFEKFITRAYLNGDETVCKLRSGVKVSFCLR